MRKVNFYAPIIRASHGDISLDLLLDTHRIDTEGEKKLRDTSDDHTHSDMMSSYTYRGSGTFDTVVFDGFFQEIPYEIYRVKGFVHLSEKPGKRFLLQKAGARITLTEDENWDKKDMENVLVFIGQNLNPMMLNIELGKCKKK
jgi:G3E family GTPase